MAEQRRHILIAVEDEGLSKNAVLYTGGMLGGSPGILFTLLHVIIEPEEDYFKDSAERAKWLAEARARYTALLVLLKDLLVQCGIEGDNVAYDIVVRRCPSLARCIIEEAAERKACTVVVSRSGKTKREEFLFGSTSSSLLHANKSCALWVVE